MLVLVQDRCMVCATLTTGSEIILDALEVPLVDEAQVKACIDHFEDSANLDARKVFGLC
jgi:hypothetical protein